VSGEGEEDGRRTGGGGEGRRSGYRTGKKQQPSNTSMWGKTSKTTPQQQILRHPDSSALWSRCAGGLRAQMKKSLPNGNYCKKTTKCTLKNELLHELERTMKEPSHWGPRPQGRSSFLARSCHDP